MKTKKHTEGLNLIEQDNLVKPKVPFTEAWKNYRESNKKRARRNKISTQAEYNRIIKDCFRLIAYLWTNSTGGVYVKGLGYFTLYRPLLKFQKEGSLEFVNNFFRTHGYSYLLTHITTLKPNDSFKGFKIKRAFTPVKYDTRDNIIKGRRYTMNSILIREYLKKRTFL